MSGQNKAEENPDEEYLLDALRNLGPTPIEELIDKSNMDDESKNGSMNHCERMTPISRGSSR